MQINRNNRESRTRFAPLALGTVLAANFVCAQEVNWVIEADPAMSDSLRSSIDKVVIKPGLSPTEEEIGIVYIESRQPTIGVFFFQGWRYRNGF